jgi:molybdate/tungstate transport system substrate-binding protein
MGFFMTKQLNVFTAGVAMEVAGQAVEKWNRLHHDCLAKLTRGGSVDGIRSFLAGEPFDLLILADDTNIASMLMPDHCGSYHIFAGNKMVLAASPDRPEAQTLNSSNWLEKILDPKTTFFHFDPHGDPGGYRAVMTMLLADQYQAGLSDKLLKHPGRICQKPGHNNQAGKPVFDYLFAYYSMAKSRGLAFAELPDVMDLSQEKLADNYSKVKFEVDDKTTVIGAPITHALTIPLKTPYPQEAQELANLFLAIDFSAFNFLPRSGRVGSRLDAESRSS